jgi:serine/threonine-protein kinase
VLAERRGADGFRLPVALEASPPERYEGGDAYVAAMAPMAGVALRVAQIRQDNLVDVHNFVAPGGVRVLEMEWVDGFDLRQLLTPRKLQQARRRADEPRRASLDDVIVTAGVRQPRLKPGIAVAVLRDGLAALSALPRERIGHGDVKPANGMLKRTGNAKLIDIGSAFEVARPPAGRSFTPGYAAPEVHGGAAPTLRSDLASLGYVLVEMLSGRRPFGRLRGAAALARAKAALPGRLARLPSGRGRIQRAADGADPGPGRFRPVRQARRGRGGGCA